MSALLVILVALLAMPGFWYCLVALLCATIIAEGASKAGSAIAAAISEHAESREPAETFLP